MKKILYILIASTVCCSGCKPSYTTVVNQILNKSGSPILEEWKTDTIGYYFNPYSSLDIEFISTPDEYAFYKHVGTSTFYYDGKIVSNWLREKFPKNEKYLDAKYLDAEYIDYIVSVFNRHLKTLYKKQQSERRYVGYDSRVFDNLMMILVLSKLSGIAVDYDYEPATVKELKENPEKLLNPLRLIKWSNENRDSIKIDDVIEILKGYEVYKLNNWLQKYMHPDSAFVPDPDFSNPIEQTEKYIPYYNHNIKTSPEDSIWFKRFDDIINKCTEWY